MQSKGVGGTTSSRFHEAVMSSEFTPNIAPLSSDGSGAPPETTQDAPEPAPITEQEVGEYREQDRFLPVSTALLRIRPSLFFLFVTDTSVGRSQM